MDALADVIAWLNANSGAINALATSLSVVVAALASAAAIVTVTRSQRRERCSLDVFANPAMAALNSPSDYQPAAEFVVVNRGPAAPLIADFDFDRRLGDSIPRLETGASEKFLTQTGDVLKNWCRVRISWLEPTGRKRRLHFWYRIEGEWDAPENRRKYLRVDRDERAGYFPRPHYLRRRLSPRLYLEWRARQHRLRKSWAHPAT